MNNFFFAGLHVSFKMKNDWNINHEKFPESFELRKTFDEQN